MSSALDAIRSALDELKNSGSNGSDTLTPYTESRINIIRENLADALEDEYDRGYNRGYDLGWQMGYDSGRDEAGMYT